MPNYVSSGAGGSLCKGDCANQGGGLRQAPADVLCLGYDALDGATAVGRGRGGFGEVNSDG